MKIEVSAPQGRLPDPFYQAGSAGIIVYDASGWMSVQIVAPHRHGFDAPVRRAPVDTRLALAAFETYYAYYGTWSVDEEHGKVRHHVVSSLFPAETGADYLQSIAFDGDRLIFTGPDTIAGQAVIRTKVWQRLTAATKR